MVDNDPVTDEVSSDKVHISNRISEKWPLRAVCVQFCFDIKSGNPNTLACRPHSRPDPETEFPGNGLSGQFACNSVFMGADVGDIDAVTHISDEKPEAIFCNYEEVRRWCAAEVL